MLINGIKEDVTKVKYKLMWRRNETDNFKKEGKWGSEGNAKFKQLIYFAMNIVAYYKPNNPHPSFSFSGIGKNGLRNISRKQIIKQLMFCVICAYISGIIDRS